jgi:predicted secreted protein
MARFWYLLGTCMTVALGFAIAAAISVAAAGRSAVSDRSGAVSVRTVARAAALNATVTPKDNGHAVSLGRNGRLTISFKDNNPSTGYSWSYAAKPSRSVLALVSDRTASEPSGVAGAPQPRTIIYRALAKGTTRLRLVLLPPGRGAKPTATLALTVTVN